MQRERTLIPLFVFIVILFLFSLPSLLFGSTKKEFLTVRERAWLEKMGTSIVVAPETNYPPLHFLDEDGRFKGIAEDYLQLMEKWLGVKFKRVSVHKWHDILARAKNRDIDIVPTIVQTPVREKYFKFTVPYIVSPTMIIMRQDAARLSGLKEMQGMKIAVTRGYQINDYVKQYHPYLELEPMANEVTCLRSVSSGKVDAALVQLEVASYYIEKYRIRNLALAGKSGHVYRFSFGSRNDWPHLNSILGKALSVISLEKRNEIYRRWIRLSTNQEEGQDVIKKVGKLLAIVLLLLFLAVFIFFLAGKRCTWKSEGKIISFSRFFSGYSPGVLIVASLSIAVLLVFIYLYIERENPLSRESFLSPEERLWIIKRKTPIRLAPDPSWAPIEYFDSKGAHRGITADLLREIEKRTGLDFRIVRYPAWDNILRGAERGDVDCLSSVVSKEGFRSYLRYTRPYLKVSNVILTRSRVNESSSLGELQGKRVAVVRGHAVYSFLKKDYPGIIYIKEVDTATGLKKLSFGEVDAMVADLPSATWFTAREGLTNVKVAGITPYTNDIAFGIRKELPLLHSIMDKTLKSISADELKKIQRRWIGLPAEKLTDSSLFRYISMVMAVAAVIIIVIFLWNLSLRRVIARKSIELSEELAERYRAEKALVRERDINELVIQTSPLFYAAINAAGEILRVNSSLLEKTGFAREELIGHDFVVTLIKEEEKESVRKVLKEMMEETDQVEHKSHIVSRDGHVIKAEWYGSSVFTRKGELEFVFLLGIDISERERTQQIMIQTEKMMTVAGLAAGMAHEINNPLGIISLALQNARRRLDPGNEKNRKAAEKHGLDFDRLKNYLDEREYNKFIDSIHVSTERAAKIVSNMLQFSRHAGSERQWVDLNEIIDEALELASSDYDIKKKYDFKTVVIKKEYSDDLPLVYCVRTEIEQVVFNLLKNAAQAISGMEKKDYSPFIRIATRKEGDWLVIIIEDNGPGMDEQTVNHAFEPFYTTKSAGDGTGLGLSVAYFIITQNHSGSIKLQSRPGEGTLFHISLPQS